MKVRFIQLGVFLILLSFIEIGLRYSGELPGSLSGDFVLLDSVIYEPLFRADSLGVNSYIPDSPHIPEGFEVNNEGYRNPFDFDWELLDSIRKIDNKKLIMVVGDSYTEGCCAFPFSKTFVNLLRKNEELIMLNFGIGNTDLDLHKLLIDKYAKIVKPDLVLLVFYTGNDVVFHEKTVTPYVPNTYPIKGFRWLSSNPPPAFSPNYPSFYFKTPKEAYNFYVKHYTLKGDRDNFIELALGKSVVCSKLYLGGKEKLSQFKFKLSHMVKWDEKKETNKLLQAIKGICKAEKIPFVATLIPSPKEAVKNNVLADKYKEHFKEITAYFPETTAFDESDYDGLHSSNHFNNSGHEKYADFLEGVIHKTLENNDKGL